MGKDYKVCWLSAGISSFIAGYLNDTATFTDEKGKEHRRTPIDEYIYIDIKDQHPDSMRFIKDCEKIIESISLSIRNMAHLVQEC